VVAINQETLPMFQWIISEYEHNSLEKKTERFSSTEKKLINIPFSRIII
jgi:hypothetical protein